MARAPYRNSRGSPPMGTSPFRYRIQSSWMPGVATQHAPCREHAAAPGTVFAQSVDGVLRAGRRKPAVLSEKRTEQVLVGAQQADEKTGHGLILSQRSASSRRIARRSSGGRTSRRQLTIKSIPDKGWRRKVFPHQALERVAAELRRSARFETASPRRAAGCPFGMPTRKKRCGHAHASPSGAGRHSGTDANEPAYGCAGKRIARGLLPVQGMSRARPRRRRALRMARPARVRMRARNPCVRLRRRLLG